MSVVEFPFQSAASSQYTFTAEGVLPAVFSVLGFESDAYELCSDYSFKVELHSLERVPAETMLGRRASLVITWDGEPVYVHGYVSRFQQTGRSAQKGYEYMVELRSPVWLLQQRYQSRVFLNQSIPQIIEEVCRSAGVDKLALLDSTA